MCELKTLYLTVKKEWFDMILSGEKKEEYREIKVYWYERLVSYIKFYPSNNSNNIEHEVNFKDFDFIVFKNGYSKNAHEIKVECKGIYIGKGNPEWGAPVEDVFIIKLGKIIEIKNIE